MHRRVGVRSAETRTRNYIGTLKFWPVLTPGMLKSGQFFVTVRFRLPGLL